MSKFAPKDPAVRTARAQKGKAKSPWAREPACLTPKAAQSFEAQRAKAKP